MKKPTAESHSSQPQTADSSQISTSTSTEHPRPPCRGCLPDCPNYAHCDGKPWRVSAE
ncbi:hypothetical protein IMCC1989_1184 [gamma proteobacterium IMCC1989]|nr:hypothetical protein IMCC1989_1184 [gamma proteobacterium IMCC1989]